MNGRSKDEDMHALIGTLLEAAIRDQKAIREAVHGLNNAGMSVTRAGQNLPSAVAQQVELLLKHQIDEAADKLVKRFNDANTDAERAATAYQAAAKFSLRRFIIPTLSMTALGLTAMVCVAWILMPDLAELKARREENAQLKQRLLWLEQKGANADMSSCLLPGKKTGGRLCVKIDPNFGDQWGAYRIVAKK